MKNVVYGSVALVGSLLCAIEVAEGSDSMLFEAAIVGAIALFGLAAYFAARFLKAKRAQSFGRRKGDDKAPSRG